MKSNHNSTAATCSSQKSTAVVRSALHRNLAVIFLLLLSLAGLRAATVEVLVGEGGLKFTPASVTIQVGDTVQWTWKASGHSSTSGTPGAPDGLWDSGVQNSGFTFTHTFTDAGSFAYFCTVHGGCCGMVGTVNVANPGPTPPVPLIKQGPIQVKLAT